MSKEAGRVIVITGGARADGIGCCAARKFIQEEPDCQVVILDIREEEFNEWATDLGNVCFIHTDVTDKQKVIAAKDQVIERFGKVDVLVCGSAFQDPGALPIEILSEESWRGCIEVNVNGTFFCCQAFGGEMLDKGGNIINIASLGGINPIFLSGSYSPSKAAVIMLTKQLAGEWGPRGVRANVVAPGQTYTSINKHRIDKPGARERRNQMVPLRRIGVPQDQANAIYWLSTDQAEYVNGAILTVDGGMTINTLACFMQAF